MIPCVSIIPLISFPDSPFRLQCGNAGNPDGNVRNQGGNAGNGGGNVGNAGNQGSSL